MKTSPISAREFFPPTVFCCKDAFLSILPIKLPVERNASADAPIKTTPALAATSTSGNVKPCIRLNGENLTEVFVLLMLIMILCMP